MNATGIHTRRATLIDEENLQRFRNTTGKSGLMALFAAVRAMLQMLLKPFRIVARVLYGSGNAGETSATSPIGAEQAPGAGNDAVTLPNSAQADEALAAKVAAGDGGSVSVDLSGEQSELDEVLPMLQRHMQLLLKEHLPADVDELQLKQRLTTLGEAAERGQFAHWMVTRQIGKILESLASEPLYCGMSSSSIEALVKAGAKTPEGRKLFAAGSAEESLLAKIGFRDEIFSTYQEQLRQIAKIVLRYDGSSQIEPAMLLGLVQSAADATKDKLAARFPETYALAGHHLGKLDVALNRLMAWPELGALKEQAASELQPAEQPVESEEKVVEGLEPVAAENAAVTPAPATPVAPAVQSVDGIKAPAVVAPRATGGMFGALPREPQAAADVASLREAENVVDDDFETVAIG